MIVSGLLHVRPDHVKPLSRLTSFEQFVCLLSWGGKNAQWTSARGKTQRMKRINDSGKEKKTKTPPVLANHRGEQPPNHHIEGLDGQSEAEREAEREAEGERAAVKPVFAVELRQIWGWKDNGPHWARWWLNLCNYQFASLLFVWWCVLTKQNLEKRLRAAKRVDFGFFFGGGGDVQPPFPLYLDLLRRNGHSV